MKYIKKGLPAFFTFVALLAMIFVSNNSYAQSSKTPIKTELTQANIISAEITVSGMTCQMGCANGIDRKLKTIEGVIESKTLLDTGICKVTFDKTKISLPEILQVIKDRGYGAEVAKS